MSELTPEQQSEGLDLADYIFSKDMEQAYKEWLRSMKPAINNKQFIKDEKDFSSLIIQLGHTVSKKDSTELYYIFMGNMNLIVMPDFYLYRTPGDIIDRIEQHIGHRHMLCKECHTVLLGVALRKLSPAAR